MAKFNDLTNQVFGNLVVLERGLNDGVHTRWLCKCSCGTLKLIRAQSLTKGLSKTCGCGIQEARIKRCTLHSHSCHGSVSPEYKTWQNMKRRCYSASTKTYKWYGGRGIVVCDSWKNSFREFLKDMGLKPFKGAQLDRIDPDGNYCKGNCRWVSSKVNNNNRRNSKRNLH